MKMRRMFRVSLLAWCMASVLCIPVMPVKAAQTENAVDQTVETKQQEEGILQIEDITGLDEEFEALKEESVFIIEEVEQYRRETKRKKIQRIVVVILVIAIFGVGITTGLLEKRKNASAEAEEAQTEKITGGQT